MGDVEYRCFIGGLSWSTRDDDLRDAFEKFGRLNEAKVAVDRFSGKSRGFGFVTFDEKKAMEEAIAEMNGMDLDGRSITVDKAKPQGSRDRDGDRGGYERGGRDRGRDYGGGGGRGGGGGGDCFKCGKPGHFARECPSGDGGRGGGDRYGGRDDRYGGGRSDRNGGGGGDRYGGGGRSRDGGSRGSDRYGGGGRDRDRSGPYERSSGGGGSGYRS